MPTITPIDPARATGKAKQLLDAVQAKLGITPNLMKTFATSAAALEAYLNFSGALSGGLLEAKFREQISLAVAQANSCEYCLSAHTVIGGMVGLKPEEIQSSRVSHSTDAKKNAGLQFAQAIVIQRGEVSASAVENVRKAGYSDGEIVEIVSNVALNILTNYINHVAQTEVDFPRVDVAIKNAA
jgi:uncharacterized peroxidase-related enzyme